jgi:hypothetical protein
MKLIPFVLVFLTAPVLAAPEKPAVKPPAGKPAPAKPAAPAGASSMEIDAGLKTRIEAFFKLLRDGETRDAYDKLFEGATLVNEQPDLIGDLIKSTTAVLDKEGQVESASMIRVRSAGTTLKEIVCIMNCRKRPIHWKFYAYFGDGRWQIIDTKPSFNLESFFEPDEKPASKR